jgi:sRNA-binding protein
MISISMPPPPARSPTNPAPARRIAFRVPPPVASQQMIDALAPLHAVLTEWPAVLPSAEGEPIKPLMIGAHERFVELLRADVPDALNVLEHVLRTYTGFRRYRAAVAAAGAMRHALDGTPVEPVAADHADTARPRQSTLDPKDQLVVRTTARSLKTTLVLDAASFAGLQVPNGQPKVGIEVEVAGRKVTASVNAKAVRKAAATIAEHGPDMVAVVLQGSLATDDTLADAGLVAQVKQPKPA